MVLAILVCRACRTGPSPLAAKLVAGHGAGSGRKTPAGMPGCTRGSRRNPRMAGTPTGCLESPGRSEAGTDASPGSSSGGLIRNVAVEQSWAIPIAGMQEDAAARRVPPPCPAVTLSDMGGQGERSPSRFRYLESESGCIRCKRRGCFGCISCVVDALPGQCLRRTPGANLLVAAVFRTERLRRERCSATCQRRRRPGQARRRQGRLQITAVRCGQAGASALLVIGADVGDLRAGLVSLVLRGRLV